MAILGIEIGGTKLQAALGTTDGEILDTIRGDAPSAGGAEAILGWFADSLPSFIANAASMGHKFDRIGVGFGGPVDSEAGKVLVSHQVAGWDGFPLCAWFEDRFHAPTIIANDANAAGWAEYRRGAGRSTRTFCYMNIGSGIGGALIIDGKLHNGQGLGAGEIGHTRVPDWREETRGAPVRLEDCCSGWAIERYLRALPNLPAGTPLHTLCNGNPDALTCAILGEAARNHDSFALATLNTVADTVGVAVANVVSLVHPQCIAMGGGVSLLGDVLLGPMRDAVARYVFGPFQNKYRIVPCELAEAVVLVGAILLAAESDRRQALRVT